MHIKDRYAEHRWLGNPHVPTRLDASYWRFATAADLHCFTLPDNHIHHHHDYPPTSATTIMEPPQTTLPLVL